MPTLFIFNLESLSPKPACLDPFSIHFMPQVTYILLPTSFFLIFCSDHNQDVRDEAELKWKQGSVYCEMRWYGFFFFFNQLLALADGWKRVGSIHVEWLWILLNLENFRFRAPPYYVCVCFFLIKRKHRIDIFVSHALKFLYLELFPILKISRLINYKRA